jgi:hypothetical protein
MSELPQSGDSESDYYNRGSLWEHEDDFCWILSLRSLQA